MNNIGMLLLYILFFCMLLILSYFLKKSIYGSQSYDERQVIERGTAYKAGFYTLIFALLCNGAFETFSHTTWGTPITETFMIMCLGLFVFIGNCIFRDAYLYGLEKPTKSIIIFLIIGGINLSSGIREFTAGTAFDENHKFQNISLITGLLLLLISVLLVIRWCIDKRQEDEN